MKPLDDTSIAVEERDVRSRATFFIGWTFAISLVVLAGFLWWAYHPSLRDWIKLAGSRILPKPFAKLQDVRAAEERSLNTYAWADPERRHAKIPIERAMEIAAEKGLIKLGGRRAP